ncbi:hypothetical protein [Methylocystis sp.]|uniref:hypothetical protein n=1 Tax=Methylocystis sp. TaxID=1911079 RepID=UPI003D0D1C73
MTDAPALLQHRFQTAETQRNVWFATVETNIQAEDVLKPDFWRHLSGQIQPYDVIEVGVDSCEWRLELLVCDVWHQGCRVVELGRIEMGGQEVEDQSAGDDMRARWRGPVNKWCVVRIADGVVLKGGIGNKTTAFDVLSRIAAERARAGN